MHTLRHAEDAHNASSREILAQSWHILGAKDLDVLQTHDDRNAFSKPSVGESSNRADEFSFAGEFVQSA